ncbi:MAG: hypothetical protein AAGL98_01610, partial [Planctomycetota bacterium]
WVMNDPWDTPLRYAAKVSHTDTFENDDYLPAHPTPFFASAGPDGLWGNAVFLEDREQNRRTLTAAEELLADQAVDNLYSFEID